MRDKLILYVSAAPDLRVECDALNRGISAIPTSLGWRIVRTPPSDRDPDFGLIARADVHVLLLGADIRAPVGLEWLTARRAGRPVHAWRKSSALPTQSALGFVRETRSAIAWQSFADAADLRAQAVGQVIAHMLAHARELDLGDDEQTRLREYRTSLTPAGEAAAPRNSGADKGAIILSTERFEPSGAILLGPAPAQP